MTLRPLLLSALAAALAPPTALASPEHPVLFLRHVGSDRDDPALTGRFLTSLQAGIEKEFPCARVWNQAQVSDLLERERRCQLQGGDCGGLKTVKDIYCGTEYVVATESATGPWACSTRRRSRTSARPRSSPGPPSTRSATPGLPSTRW
jgi:hypothetical protein